MRVFFVIAAVFGLAACQPPVPNSGPIDTGRGVGFGTADDFRAQQAARDRELQRAIVDDQTAAAVDAVIPGPVDVTTLGQEPAAGASETDELVADASAAIDRSVQPERSGEISDEQDFGAVSERESIESDAARIAANREQFQVIQPTEVPTRTNAGPNIVQYALSTTNIVGQQVHRRSGLSGQNRFLRNCAEYASADQAQQDFLARGGPERDRRGLDPDGDGFACGWDPAPFRVVAN
ncbi:MAG: hypothetical protein AAGF13_10355 [Pseudomonadota bacterium]